MTNLALERLHDVHQFEALAGAFLGEREAENNLVLGLITELKGGRTFGPERPYFCVVRSGDAIEAAAMRTPPFSLHLTAGTAPDAVQLIVEDVFRSMPGTPGVAGPKELAALAAKMWSARTGANARVVMTQRIYQLTQVIPTRGTSGTARVAREADGATITDWFAAFAAEALPAGGHPASPHDAAEAATSWIASGALWVWSDGGLVAMAGARGGTPNGIRVGAVYTPPDKRRRGYASALVATLSQAQLDAGRRFCFLYTNLSNPTSNKIYQAIGYEPISDVDDYRFEGSAEADT